MKKKLQWAAVCASILFLIGWLVAPAIVQWQIHKQHPDVTVGSVTLHWSTVDLHGVHLSRDWVQADFTEAHVSWDALRISAQGGEVTVDLDKRPTTGDPTEKRSLSIKDVSVHITKKDLRADLTHVSFDAGNASFSTAMVNHPRATVRTGAGSYTPTRLTLDAADVTAVTDMSMLSRGQAVKLVGVQVSLHDKEFSDLNVDGVEFDLALRPDQITHIKFAGVHLTATYALSIKEITFQHPWISVKPATFRNLVLNLNDFLSITTQRVAFNPDAKDVNLSLNGAKLHIDLTALRVSGSEDCQTWIQALPEELRLGPLASAKLSGKLGFDVTIRPTPHLSITGGCQSTCDASEITALRRHFAYTAYDQDGKPFERTTGIDSEDWVPLDKVNKNMPLAVMNMEDLGFRSHHGFIVNALENSLISDLRTGKFSRGGSTITMQLAKNVWLRRDKTLGRKVEELLLSQVLESCFSKDEIMEMYLNIVEFGPNVYGIGPAAEHYFRAPPMELDGAQSFYLASVLPNPRKAPPADLNTLARMGALMRTLVAQGRLPNSMALDTVQPEDAMGWEVIH